MTYLINWYLSWTSLIKLSYDKILSQTLEVGITYRRIQDGEVVFSASIADVSDVLVLPGTEIRNYSSDGTNTFMTVYYPFTEPILLYGNRADSLVLTVNDNMSGFLKFTASSGCKLFSGDLGEVNGSQ